MVRLPRLIGATLAIAMLALPAAQAQTPGGTKQKSSYPLMKKLSAGAPQDFIVEFASGDNDTRRTAQSASASLDSNGAPDAKAAKLQMQKQRVFASLAAGELSVLRNYNHLPLEYVQVRNAAALQKLLASPEVLRVHENRQERTYLAESLPLIGANQSNAQGNAGAGTAVAVFDTGVDYTRSAFGNCTAAGVPASCRVAHAQDIALDDGSLDNDGHGTNVAAIVLGVAPATKIIALDVFTGSPANDDLSASSADILAAINWVIANKARYNIVAINMSLGGRKFTAPDTNGVYTAAVARARAAGVLTVAASGNDGFTNAMGSPGAAPQVISVGAVYDASVGGMNFGPPSRCQDGRTAADKVTCFSNSASFLSLLAPGSQISAGGTTGNGTSQASPHVAGAVAVLRAAQPNESLDQTVARLLKGPAVIDTRNDLSKPRLSLPAALDLGLPCTYALSVGSRSFEATGGSGSVGIVTGAGCPWTAAAIASSVDWIVLSAPTSGNGSASLAYTVKANANVSSRSGAITVGGQTHTVTQSGSLELTVNLLKNPDFENGPTSWISSTANGLDAITTYLKPSTTNAWYAWLCGYDSCVDSIYQDISIPADTREAYLQFNYWVSTNEVTSLSRYDSMTVKVLSPPGSAAPAVLATLSNLSSTNGWIPSARYDLTAYKGKTIRLQFTGVTDASFETSFYLDDVALMATGAAPDRQPPSTPAGLAAKALSTTAISLSWQAAQDNVGVTAYQLRRNGELIATLGPSTGFIDTGLGDNSQHRYAITACDAAGNCSPQSAEVVASTLSSVVDTLAPSAPGLPSASATSASTMTLSWQVSTDNVGVINYQIYRNGVLIATIGNSTSYADSGLVPATRYSYTVAACDLVGNCSAQSVAAAATTQSAFANLSSISFSGNASYSTQGGNVTIKIDKIVNSSATYKSGSLRLALWALQSPYLGGSANGYIVASVRTSSVNGLSDQLSANSSFSNISLSLPFTAPPSTHKSYVLFLEEYIPSRCDDADKFCFIAYMPFHEIEKPTVPTGLRAAVVSRSQIDLAWNASSDNAGVATYKISRDGQLRATVGNVTSFSDVGLLAASTYRYGIAACDVWDNCSAEGAAASATTLPAPDTLAPSVPQGLVATAVASDHVLVSWTAAQDNVAVTAYKLYSGDRLVATLGGSATSSFRSNTPQSNYSYTVSACDAAGNCSAASPPAVVTTPAEGSPANSTGTYYVPWLSNASGYVSRLVLSNRAASDASYQIQLLSESGSAVNINNNFASGTLAAKSETVIRISDLLAAGQPQAQAAAVLTITGAIEAISGLYNIVNPITGSISSTDMLRASASSSATALLPTFSTAIETSNKLVFMNAGSSSASLSASVITTPGVAAQMRRNSWTIPARTQLIFSTADMVSLTGGQQASAIFDLGSSAASVKGLYLTSSPATGSVSNLALLAPSSLGSSPTTLMMPWFSTTPGYNSQFFLLNRGDSPAPYSVTVLNEPGNAPTLGTTTGTIPARSQLVVDARSIVTSFPGATRGAAIFTIQAPNSQIAGAYQIANPSTGSVSNTAMIGPSTSLAATTRLSTPWFTTDANYLSRFVLVNRSSTPAAVGITIQTEKNNAPTQLLNSLVIPPRSVHVVASSAIVSSFSAGTRAAIVFDIAGADAQIDGLYNVVNPVTGSINSSLMVRDGVD
ncbi:MAG: S8 family serine peptidase [Burkholderiaceae bacterium]|nr:S8 family serine peptidase [Burkholderiaceae bacterium]